MKSSSLLWLWEFSKKAVRICMTIYVLVIAYAMTAMWTRNDFAYLGTLIEQTSDILKVCVFGYLIKAGAENVVRIRTSPQVPEEDPQPQEDDGPVVPQ